MDQISHLDRLRKLCGVSLSEHSNRVRLALGALNKNGDEADKFVALGKALRDTPADEREKFVAALEELAR